MGYVVCEKGFHTQRVPVESVTAEVTPEGLRGVETKNGAYSRGAMP